MEIIGTGYGKKIEIGESYLRERTICMWDLTSMSVYTYMVSGISHTIQKCTKTSENAYKCIDLTIEEVNTEMINTLKNKHKNKSLLL